MFLSCADNSRSYGPQWNSAAVDESNSAGKWEQSDCYNEFDDGPGCWHCIQLLVEWSRNHLVGTDGHFWKSCIDSGSVAQANEITGQLYSRRACLLGSASDHHIHSCVRAEGNLPLHRLVNILQFLFATENNRHCLSAGEHCTNHHRLHDVPDFIRTIHRSLSSA